MKKFLSIILIAISFVRCNNTTEEENKIVYTKLTIASEKSYVIGEDGLPWSLYIAQETNNKDAEWDTLPILGSFGYERGYEYTILAHKEVVNPESIPEKHDFWWRCDKVLEKVKKESDIPEDIYIYTYDSPWGFDPRDPFLEYMLEHYKEIFGEEFEITYSKKQ